MRRVIQISLVVLSLVSFVVGVSGVPKISAIVDDSVGQQEKDNFSELLALLLNCSFSLDTPLPGGGLVLLITASGEVQNVWISDPAVPQPGIRVGFSTPETVVNALRLPTSQEGWKESVLVIEAVSYATDTRNLNIRLQEAISNIELLSQYSISDLGIVVVSNLLAGDQKAVGDQIIREFNAVDAFLRVVELENKRVLAFVAHDPEKFFSQFRKEVMERGIDIKDKFLLFFVCGTEKPEWLRNFESIQDELIYTYQAAGLLHFTGPIDIEAVRAFLKVLTQQPDIPILQALMRAFYLTSDKSFLRELFPELGEEQPRQLKNNAKLETSFKFLGWC
jgi:hypothetical protein